MIHEVNCPAKSKHPYSLHDSYSGVSKAFAKYRCFCMNWQGTKSSGRNRNSRGPSTTPSLHTKRDAMAPLRVTEGRVWGRAARIVVTAWLRLFLVAMLVRAGMFLLLQSDF